MARDLLDRDTMWRSLAMSILLPALAASAAFGSVTPAPAMQSLDSIRGAAERQVRERLPRDAVGETYISVGPLDRRLRLAACAARLQAQSEPASAWGARTVIRVRCPGPVRWSLQIPVAIESEAAVLVARRSLVRGEPLTSADVEVQRRRVTGLSHAYAAKPEDLQGRRLKRALPAGTAVPLNALAPDVLIRRGQQVTLVAMLAGIEVRAAGTALADAGPADRVRVRNSSSLAVVEGVVESADIVRVSP
jgi:flagella basal body P-ring formation protein FlgA